jgi:hypothetical protein
MIALDRFQVAVATEVGAAGGSRVKEIRVLFKARDLGFSRSPFQEILICIQSPKGKYNLVSADRINKNGALEK